MDNYPDELIKLLKLKDIEKNLLTYKKNYRIKKIVGQIIYICRFKKS